MNYDNIPLDLLKQAINVQDACNLGAIVHGFSRVIKTIQEQAREEGHGTAWINLHPVVKMFCDKLTDLSCVRESKEYSEAYDIVANQLKERSVDA